MAFGRYALSRASVAAVQRAVDCWASAGAWVPGTGTRPESGHVLDHEHLWGPHQCPDNWGNVALNLSWVPAGACAHRLRAPRLAEFCAALAGRHVLMVGDSLDQQLHDYVVGFTLDANPSCPGHNCRGHVICDGAPGGAWPAARFTFRRNDRVLVSSVGTVTNGPGPENLWEEGWADLVDAEPPVDIAILNRGIHVRPDDEVMTQLRATMAWLRARPRPPLVLWRSTVAGHPDCSRLAEPLTARDPRVDAKTAPHQWGQAIEQSARVRTLLASEFGDQVVWMDVETATSRRPDSHEGNGDCLHYCLPGPLDWWLRLLVNVVEVLSEVGDGGAAQLQSAAQLSVPSPTTPPSPPTPPPSPVRLSPPPSAPLTTAAYFAPAALLAACPPLFATALAEYSAWHAATLAAMAASAAAGASLSLPAPVVVARCHLVSNCGGAGDRFVGAAALFYYALRTRALFFIDMPALATAARPTTFDWRYDAHAATLAPFGAAPTGADDLYSCPMKGRDCVLQRDFNYTPVGAAERRFWYVTTNRGLWAAATAQGHRDRLRDVGLDGDSWGCVYRALLRPTDAMIDEIAGDTDRILAAPAPVCMHHRGGDSNMAAQGRNGEYGRIEERLACVREAVRLLNSSDAEPGASARAAGLRLWAGTLAPRDVHVYLAADSAAFKTAATALLGLVGVDVHASTVRPAHTNEADADRFGTPVQDSPTRRMHDALHDWFTLAACPVWAGSISSSFARTAAAYALTTRFMAANTGALPEDAAAGEYCRGFMSITPFLHMSAGTRLRA